jgi:hypothetical protein
MPTYNGKEIASTSRLNGLSLVVRTSITIGGKVFTLTTPPLEMNIYGNGSYTDERDACFFGPSDKLNGKELTKVYIQDNGGGLNIYGYINYALFYDSDLTSPVNPGFYWSDDTTNIGGGIESSSISIPKISELVLQRCIA